MNDCSLMSCKNQTSVKVLIWNNSSYFDHVQEAVDMAVNRIHYYYLCINIPPILFSPFRCPHTLPTREL